MQCRENPVWGMFRQIAYRYDFLNHLLSFNLDRLWRRRAIRMAKEWKPESVLDLACGTGDITIDLLRKVQPKKLVGADLTSRMLAVCKMKLRQGQNGQHVELVECEAEALPFEEEMFDLITIGFGVRNFTNVPQAIAECSRVLRPGGRLMVLELSQPPKGLFRLFYHFYSYQILPIIGGLVSGSFAPYRYLPRSVSNFAKSGILQESIRESGLQLESRTKLTYGIAEITVSRRPVTMEQKVA